MRTPFELIWLRIEKAGFSLAHPQCWAALSRGVAPSLEHRSLLHGLEFDLLLDVGANRGQFTLMARLLRPDLRIHAYEPLPSEAAVFRRIHGGKQGIDLHQLALGDRAGTADLHVSASADSSSLLPIGDAQARLFPNTGEVGCQRVTVSRLDDLPGHWQSSSRALLKLDVQGFELNVLRGATAALRNCTYVYAECSELALYSGQALRSEVEDFLHSQGFAGRGRFNPFFAGGALVQADYLYGRA